MPTSSDLWTRLEAALADLVPALPAALAPPATTEALDALSEKTGRDVRPALADLYDHHDGEPDDAPGLFVGLRFLPAAEAADEWARWSEMIHDDPSLVADIAVTARPEGAVQPVYFSDAWIPIAADGAGNGLAVDLDPGPDGSTGQVISFGADEPTRTVLAPSAAAFLEWIAESIADGTITAADEPDAPGGKVLAIGASRHLLDVLPTLFGAD